jgi:hypothetical protein
VTPPIAENKIRISCSVVERDKLRTKSFIRNPIK